MIVLTGGKTGGHIMPLLAIAKKLNQVCYVGSYDSLEERLCKEHHIDFIGMKLKNNRVFTILKCFLKLKLKNVSAIISTGGYVSFPALIYGIFHRIPIFLLEENVIMGKTNHFFSLFAKQVFLTYPLEKMKKKYKVVGLPILMEEMSYLKYRNYTFDILIIGGSLGSKPLCDLVHQLNSTYKICLIAGRYCEEYKDIDNTIVLKYVNDLPNLMLQSKLIISRAGASTTYEIFSLEKPCIIIPSKTTSKNHQYLNALYFENKGCCRMVKEDNAKEEIYSEVSRILDSESIMVNMRDCQRKLVVRNSCEKILNEMEKL